MDTREKPKLRSWVVTGMYSGTPMKKSFFITTLGTELTRSHAQNIAFKHGCNLIEFREVKR